VVNDRTSVTFIPVCQIDGLLVYYAEEGRRQTLWSPIWMLKVCVNRCSSPAPNSYFNNCKVSLSGALVNKVLHRNRSKCPSTVVVRTRESQ
jgi:hypothetical protein